MPESPSASGLDGIGCIHTLILEFFPFSFKDKGISLSISLECSPRWRLLPRPVLSGHVLMAANDFKRQGDRPEGSQGTLQQKLNCCARTLTQQRAY